MLVCLCTSLSTLLSLKKKTTLGTLNNIVVASALAHRPILTVKKTSKIQEANCLYVILDSKGVNVALLGSSVGSKCKLGVQNLSEAPLCKERAPSK